MPAVFGSATIAGAVVADGYADALAVQPPIGFNAISTVTNPAMANGHIGAAQGQNVGATRAAEIAANNTPGVKADATAIKWATATGTWVLGP